MNYTVTIKRTEKAVFEVEAESRKKALAKATEEHRRGNVLWDPVHIHVKMRKSGKKEKRS